MKQEIKDHSGRMDQLISKENSTSSFSKSNDYLSLVPLIPKYKSFIFSNNPEEILEALNFFGLMYEYPQCHHLYLEPTFIHQLFEATIKNSNIKLDITFAKLLYNFLHRNKINDKDIFQYINQKVQTFSLPLDDEKSNCFAYYLFIINQCRDFFLSLLLNSSFILHLLQFTNSSSFLNEQICKLITSCTICFNSELKAKSREYNEHLRLFRQQHRDEFRSNPNFAQPLRDEYKSQKHSFQIPFQNALISLLCNLILSPITEILHQDPASYPHFLLNVSSSCISLSRVSYKNSELRNLISALTTREIWNVSNSVNNNLLTLASIQIPESLRSVLLGEIGTTIFESVSHGLNKDPLYYESVLRVIAARVDDETYSPAVFWNFKPFIVSVGLDWNLPMKVRAAAGICFASFAIADPIPFCKAFTQNDFASSIQDVLEVIQPFLNNPDDLDAKRDELETNPFNIDHIGALLTLFFSMDDIELDKAIISALYTITEEFKNNGSFHEWTEALTEFALDDRITELMSSDNQELADNAEYLYNYAITGIIS